MNTFAVTAGQGEFYVVEVADNGAQEPVVRFPTEAEAREWLGRNQRLLDSLGSSPSDED